MKKLLFLFWTLIVCATSSFCQNVGIGTTSPNSRAILDIKTTDKGILFPRLTTAQRNAITNPPNGLHIFNTDQGCLNYFDSLITVWNCYCDSDTCKVVTIRISADADSINFYDVYGKNYPNTKKFVVVVNTGVTIKGGPRAAFIGFVMRPAIDFSTMPSNGSVKIINRGNIFGMGGVGGGGATGDGVAHGTCTNNTAAAGNGSNGGPAIETKTGWLVTVDNYGVVAGGAGGGGGGGRTTVGQFGGGGGGGASFGLGGVGGGYTGQNCNFIGCGPCTHIAQAQYGNAGQLTTGGTGGNGASGGGNGGAGGALGQPGQAGTGTAAGSGGGLGKAINGGSGNGITNISGGILYGSVD